MSEHADRPLFAPWERLTLLTIAADDLPETPANALVRLVTMACAVTIRNLQGTATREDAYAHIARAQEAIRVEARKGVVTDGR